MNRRLIAAGFLAYSILVVQAHAGLVYTTVTKTELEQGRSMAATSQTRFEGNNLRIDYQDNQNPLMKKGSYMLIRDFGKNICFVNPDDKTYIMWDMKVMGAKSAFKVSNLKTETILDEKGPKMLGQATRHVKWSLSYDMEISFMGMQNVQSVTIETESWVSTMYKELVKLLQANVQSSKTGNENMDKLIEANAAQITGLPLKEIRVTRMTDVKKGKTNVNTLTSEITAITEQDISKDVFEIPAGFTEKILSMPGAGGGSSGAARPPPPARPPHNSAGDNDK